MVQAKGYEEKLVQAKALEAKVVHAKGYEENLVWAVTLGTKGFKAHGTRKTLFGPKVSGQKRRETLMFKSD